MLFFCLGLVCGYTTSIRVMGVMLMIFILSFLVLDIILSVKNRAGVKRQILDSILFIVGFCISVYIAWPYLWKAPVSNLIESYSLMSHYDWDSQVFINGHFERAMQLPWTYFPIWFAITTPVLWLLAGIAGVFFIIKDFIKQPAIFVRNTNERAFIMYLACFFVPVLAVILLHSVIYDDWRHLYFIFPSFVLIALYAINKAYNSRSKRIVIAACIIQSGFVGFFMIADHPFQQVYFNHLVSHADESLRNNYELDYWGSSYKEGLEFLASGNESVITIASDNRPPLFNNIDMLPEKERKRFRVVTAGNAAYFITNFRNHPDDFPSTNIVFSKKVLNSTILRIYRLAPTTAKASH